MEDEVRSAHRRPDSTLECSVVLPPAVALITAECRGGCGSTSCVGKVAQVPAVRSLSTTPMPQLPLPVRTARRTAERRAGTGPRPGSHGSPLQRVQCMDGREDGWGAAAGAARPTPGPRPGRNAPPDMRRRRSRSSPGCSRRCLRRPSPTRSAAPAVTCRTPWTRCSRRRKSARLHPGYAAAA
jgi:hypothetical protein